MGGLIQGGTADVCGGEGGCFEREELQRERRSLPGLLSFGNPKCHPDIQVHAGQVVISEVSTAGSD